MPITINGSGTITGISVGGLPDGVVTVADISATGTPSSSTFLRGDGTWNAPAGGVTSAVAGNGIAVSGATGAVTFSVAAPSFNSVGSIVMGYIANGGTSGSTYSAGTGGSQVQSSAILINCTVSAVGVNNLSGTWRLMGGTNAGAAVCCFVRVS